MNERTIDFSDAVGLIRIGRRADLELSLPFSRLSGVHARLVRANNGEHKADQWLLEDLGSTNGTFVGGERLKPGSKAVMTAGTQIKFAEVEVIFDGEGQAHASGKVQVEAVGRETGKVQVEIAGKDTGRVAGKVQAEISGKSTSKVQVEVAGKATGKVQVAASNKDTGKLTTVQAEPSRKDPGRPTGKLEAEGSSKSTGKVPAASSSKVSAVKPPVNDPTQTFVRGEAPSDAVSPAATAAAVPYLTAVAGLGQGAKKFKLVEQNHVYMFGRTRRCEFHVDTAEVSREHASFTRRGDGIYVNDLGSVNGVLVNNTRVKEYRLFDGDLIQIGHVKLRLFDPTETRGRSTDSAVATPSRLAPPSQGESRHEPPTAAHAEPSSTFRSELHPAIAGALAHEGGGADGYRPRRPSVRVRLTESWEKSGKFRYGIVIVAASVLAVCAVLVALRLAD
jgi:pSer/pThr/pTyr-binding forkhead associated (FHA) protein